MSYTVVIGMLQVSVCVWSVQCGRRCMAICCLCCVRAYFGCQLRQRSNHRWRYLSTVLASFMAVHCLATRFLYRPRADNGSWVGNCGRVTLTHD